tara:strand:+ start:68 stop:1453 length:1386 start_codon:yes stop_codon:yes gene_type:complete
LKDILILINTAAFSKYYLKLAKELKNLGHNVVIATDSNFTQELFELNKSKIPVEVFKNKTEQKNGRLSDLDSWCLHPDFDRGIYYGFYSQFSGYKSSDIVENLYSFFEHVIDKYNIKTCFYENVSNGFAYIAWKVIEEKNGKYLGLTSSRLPGMCCFTTDDNDLASQIEKAQIAEAYSIDNLIFAENYLSQINDVEPDYMKNNGLSKISALPAIKRVAFHSLITHIKYSFGPENAGFQLGNPLISSIRYRFRSVFRKINSYRIRKYFKEFSFDTSKSYFLYPLHYHPESSTSLLGRFYDEFNLIKNIAFSLKSGEVLLVKDHKSAHAFEAKAFYKMLSSLPNVVLVRPEVNAKQLIDKCMGVFTLTSTVGYEAVLKNKAVVLFGEAFYKNHPLVKKINSFNEIRYALEWMKSNPNNALPEGYNRSYVASYHHVCFQFRLDLSNKDTSQGIKQLARKVEESI